MKFYEQGREKGGFEAGIRLAVQSILMSPRFLFRLEQQPAGIRTATYRIADEDLASRLSFFLWGTVPDADLVRAANLGSLKTAAGLEKQVRRMLADRKSEALATRFASQWLRLQDLDKIFPDYLLYPQYDDTLARAMKRETELFFDSIVREDRSVKDLLTADYTFVNERLAKHYDIPNITGNAFQRVTLPPYRRGLLGQGSILTLTSVADRTSPVQRGKWVMEVLLASPPPAPPPNVPLLDDSVKANEGGKLLSTRQRMEEHRKQPAVHLVPQGDRSARPGAREFRRHRRVAHQGQRSAGRRGRRPVRRHAHGWPGRPPRRVAEALGHVPDQLYREPDDVWIGPAARTHRHAGGSRHRARCGQEGRSALGLRAGRGEQLRIQDGRGG